jgi:hypothetical protein
LIAKRVGPIYGKYVASPGYIKEHGSPETPEELIAHQALMQGTEAWQLMDGDKIITVRPQGRFKADNGTALVAQQQDSGLPTSPISSPMNCWHRGGLFQS